MAGILKVASFCHSLDPGIKGFRGLLRELLVGDQNLAFVAGHLGSEGFRELLGLVETNRVGGPWHEGPW